MKDSTTERFDVIVLGGGAAGLMCAIEAGKRGRRVAVLERNRDPGEKIRISGGGRCNFTNLNTGAGQYLGSNPHFVRSALARYTPADFTRMVERHGIGYHEKAAGQLFCDRGSGQIISMLTRECASAGVTIMTGCTVETVSKDPEFVISTGGGVHRAEALVVATGGLSIPKLGATDVGYRIARQFGMNIIPTRPGLVPLTLSGAELEFVSSLSGISTGASVTCGDVSFRDSLLFTHRGLSGPAILQISSYWSPEESVTVDLSPDRDLHALLRDRGHSRRELPTALADVLPKRFAKSWCERNGIGGTVGGFSDDRLRRIAAMLHSWTLVPGGTEGFRKAEVTCGGVDTGTLSSKTMESKTVRGLYMVGEVVDVTGHLGGYNFQWAWASGFVAGQYA